MATFHEAEAAKERAKEALAGRDDIRGIGIARTSDGFGVKVNLVRDVEHSIPESLDGVPVVVETVGEIRAFGGASKAGSAVTPDLDHPIDQADIAVPLERQPDVVSGSGWDTGWSAEDREDPE